MVYTRGSSTLESYTDVCGPAALGCIQRISFPSLETQLASLVSKLDVARAERIKRTTSIFWQCLRKQKQIKCESMLSGCSVKFVWSDIKCLMPAWINQHAVGYLFLLELHYFLLCMPFTIAYSSPPKSKSSSGGRPLLCQTPWTVANLRRIRRRGGAKGQ